MLKPQMNWIVTSIVCFYCLTGVVKTNNQVEEITPEADLITPVAEISASNNMTEEEEVIRYFSTFKSGRGASVRFSTSADNNCETLTGQAGSCIVITKCAAVMKNYKRQPPKICRWENQLPIVCCPNPSLSGRNKELVCGTRIVSGTNQISNPSIRSRSSFWMMKRNKPRNNTEGKNPVIVGGKNSTIGAWPWMAGIYKKSWGIEEFLCGSTIVNERYVITAAHCFGAKSNRHIPTGRYVVRVGNSYLGRGKQYFINSIIIYPDYDPAEHYKDMAVIRLEERLQFEKNIRPICLPTRQDFIGKSLQGRNVTVTGWGVQEFGGRSSPVLQEVTVQVVDVENCDRFYIEKRGVSLAGGVTKEFICAGSNEGGKDACQSDSGGPLMILENGVFYLIGVVSFGFQCGLAGYPGVYSRVTNYLDWVEEVTSQP